MFVCPGVPLFTGGKVKYLGLHFFFSKPFCRLYSRPEIWEGGGGSLMLFDENATLKSSHLTPLGVGLIKNSLGYV